MKRTFATCVFLSIIFLVPLCAAAEAPVKIKIGLSSALTGEGATYGTDIKNALLFANEEFGGDRYEIVLEDDRCDPKTSASVANKLINIDKVRYVIGYACSGAMLAAAPLLERAKIPTVVTCASASKIADAGDYIFRTGPSDGFAARQMFNHLHGRYKTVAILSEETEYAQGLKQDFLNANATGDLKLISEDFISGTTDFRTYFIRLKQGVPEAIFVNPQAESGLALVVKQLHDLRWNIPIFSVYFSGSPSFLAVAGKLAEGLEYIDPPSLSQVLTPEGTSLYDRFRQRYGDVRSVELYFATTVEAFRALDRAIQSGKDVQGFLSVHRFDGIFGQYSFDERGEIQGLNFVVKKIVNQKAVPFSE